MKLEQSEKIKYDLGIENHNDLFLNEFKSSFKKVTSALTAAIATLLEWVG